MSDRVVDRDVVARPATRKATRPGRYLALAGIALAIGLGGAWYGYEWWTVGRFIETTDDAYVGGNVTTISPHVAGFVAAILVTDNEHVAAGQFLLRLDPRDFQAAVNRAEAIVQERTATFASLHAKYALQQLVVQQAAAELAAKRAQAGFAGEEAQRYASLARTSAGSRQNAQRTLAADREARSAVLAAQAGLASARQQLQVLDTQITEAHAAVAQAQADLQTARLNLGYTEIRSPIDGYVGNRAARVGAFVSAGAYLMSIVPSRGLWIDANFKEDQLARMTPGQHATVIADIVPGRTIRGHVLSLAPATGATFSVIPAENATGNFTKIVQRVPVRIMLDAGAATLGLLRPGLSTTVSVDTRVASKAVPP